MAVSMVGSELGYQTGHHELSISKGWNGGLSTRDLMEEWVLRREEEVL